MGKRRVFRIKLPPKTGSLGVKVVDERGQAVEGVTVDVWPGGARLETTSDGQAVFENHDAGAFEVWAGKAGYGRGGDGAEGVVSAQAEIARGSSSQITLTLHRLPKVLTENIVLVGSERYYNSFKLKMMFIAPAFLMLTRRMKLRQADETTLILVDFEYTRYEKLAVEYLRETLGVRVVLVTDVAEVVNHFNVRPTGERDGMPTKTLLQDVAIFCHGLPNKLSFNYASMPWSRMNFSATELATIDAGVFVPGGCIYSYACRTGVSKDGEEFTDDDAASPDSSLAQKMADHFGVDVYAYLTRTFYGDCLVGPGGFEDLTKALKAARAAGASGVVSLPPQHEALPHPGIGGSRAEKEGTKDYALWRVLGAIALPVAGETPKGLSTEMRQFRPCE